MARQHQTLSSLIRALRSSPASFAAAAALQDPGPLLQLQAHSQRERTHRGLATSPR
jgi:hypothetical protein